MNQKEKAFVYASIQIRIESEKKSAKTPKGGRR